MLFKILITFSPFLWSGILFRDTRCWPAANLHSDHRYWWVRNLIDLSLWSGNSNFYPIPSWVAIGPIRCSLFVLSREPPFWKNSKNNWQGKHSIYVSKLKIYDRNFKCSYLSSHSSWFGSSSFCRIYACAEYVIALTTQMRHRPMRPRATFPLTSLVSPPMKKSFAFLLSWPHERDHRLPGGISHAPSHKKRTRRWTGPLDKPSCIQAEEGNRMKYIIVRQLSNKGKMMGCKRSVLRPCIF